MKSFKLKRCRNCEFKESDQKGPPADTGRKEVFLRR